MARRALIIQSGYDPLAGFANSAACIGQALAARGFELVARDGPGASRDGILRACDELIAGACAGDAIVIYYVGHGGLATNGTYTPDAELPRYIQHLCPTDFGQTTDDEFRGISTFELALRLAALTRKTRNATVILECCFAAQLARGDDPAGAARVSPTLTRVGLTRHLQALRERSRDFEELEVTGNKDAVRVAATGQTESAYQLALPSSAALRAIGIELPGPGWAGAMTLRLVEILAEIADRRVTWRSIAAELRSRLIVQRPEIEGPVTRVPFSLATVDATTFEVRGERGGAVVDAGRLHGVSIGDVYGVMPAGSARIEPAGLVAELTIDETSAVHSRASRIAWRAGASELPAGAVAIARSLALEREPVRVVAGAAALPSVAAALAASRRIRAATPQDRDVACELRIRGAALEVCDERGPLFPPAAFPERLPDAVKDLENLATERRLRALAEDAGLSPAGVSVTLLVAGAGGHRALADHGEALGLGDRLAIRLDNRTAKPVFANVFAIGLRREIALLSDADASGIRLAPNTPTFVGTTIAGGLAGFELEWPDGLPRDQPRVDAVMVVVTEEPADLRVLESPEHLGKLVGPATSLQALLAQLAGGKPRTAAGPGVGFAVCWRDFRLFPLDGSLDFGAPQVDASPTGSAAPGGAGGASPTGAAAPGGAGGALQIRIEALAVTPATTRVDVLVCARSSPMPYRATTVIGDAPRDLVVWTGELAGPADVYVWTSPHRGDRRTLAELMADRPVDAAVAVLRGSISASTPALAAGASMQLAAIARASLLGLAPEVATAFRGAFSAGAAGGAASGGRVATAAASFAITVDRRG